MTTPEFVNLHVHAHTSLLDGYSTMEEYLKEAERIGQRGIGNTDHGNLFGAYTFVNKARDMGITPTPGMEFYVAPENPAGAKHIGPIFYGPDGKKAPQYDVSANGAYLHLTVWAYNNVGLYNLFKLATLSNDPERFYKTPRIDFNLLADHAEGLIVSTGCPSSEISTRFLLGQDKKAHEYAGRLKEVFGDNLFVEIMNHDMPIDLERVLLPKQLELSKKLGIPLLATNDCHYAHKGDALPHEEMLCTQSGSRMSEKRLDEGGTRFAFSGDQYYLKSAAEMAEIFPERDFPGALSNTLKISEMSSDIKIDYNPHLKPKPIVPPEFKNEVDYYKYLINQGYKKHYGQASIEIKKEAQLRNKKEFEVIHSSDFIGYMLVVREYIMYGKETFSTRNQMNEIVASSVGVGRGCFLPGNKVHTNRGQIPIEKMSVETKHGNIRKVLTHDGTLQNVEKVFVYDVKDEDCLEIELSNGQTITCTSDHMLFMKNRGFVAASEFSLEDTILGSKKSHDMVSAICDSCGKTNEKIAVKELKKCLSVDSYKKVGEYYCTNCANKIIYSKIESIRNGVIKGALRNKDSDVKEKNSITNLAKWADPEYKKYRSKIFSEYAATSEFSEKCRQRNMRRYSSYKELEKLSKLGFGGKYKHGKFKSERLSKELYYASSYELKALNIFETDSSIESYDRCKDIIQYQFENITKRYLPDFKVILKDGTIKVIEIKAKWELETEKFNAKKNAAIDFYNKQNIIYEVWTEKELEKYNDWFHNETTIVNIKKFKYTGKVYDLQVANVHNYTIADITVHNSVGGSIHAYELGISDIDPIAHDLIFERFLGPGRGATYKITYDDGTSEDIIVSGKKHISTVDENGDSTTSGKYIHQLSVGDEVIVEENIVEENIVEDE